MARRKLPNWPKTMPSIGFGGIYINLDRASVRRGLIENEIRKFGLESGYIRLPASDGQNLRGCDRAGAAIRGCYLSHMRAADMARKARMPVHVIEDDAKLSRHVAPFVAHASATGLLERFDIVFLDMWVDPRWDRVCRYEELFRQAGSALRDLAALSICDMRGLRVGSAKSYVVGPRGAERLFSALQARNRNLPPMAVDAYMDSLVQAGELSACVVVPFLTAGNFETGVFSTIQNIGQQQMLLHLLLRTSFFIDADIAADILPKLDTFRAGRRYENLEEIRHLLVTRPGGD